MDNTTIGGNQSDDLPLPRIPDHELLRCVGGGGYGEVWLARNVMGTYRAVKVVYRAKLPDARSYGREYHGMEKFEPVSRSHDGFVDILQVGRNDHEGYYYCVMELADDLVHGQKINPDEYKPKTLGEEKLKQGKLPFKECLEIGLSLASALSHLHKNNLIHRDIKPANVIFVNGIPKIADIGLVVEIGVTHSLVGTEGYMPPEGPGTVQADVFSLGKVLYEISTGHNRHEYPVFPTNLDEMTEQQEFLELNEVTTKACAGDPGKRYRTADEMHKDLVFIQAGHSLRRLHQLERRMASLKKAAAIAAVVLLVASVAGFEIRRLNRIEQELKQQQVGRNVAYATRQIDDGDHAGALPALVEALQLDHDNPERLATRQIQIASVLRQCPKIVQMWPLGVFLNKAELSPDGNWLATAGKDGRSVICDLSGAKSPRIIVQNGPEIESATWSPDNRKLCIAREGGVEIWDVETGMRERIMEMPGHVVYSARFSPDAKRIVAASRIQQKGSITVWDLEWGTQHVIATSEEPYRSARFNADGSRVAMAGQSTLAEVLDRVTGERIGPPIQHDSWCYDAVFGPDERLLASTTYKNAAVVSDFVTGKPLFTLRHRDAVRAANFSPDGRYLVTASWDYCVRIWSLSNGMIVPPILRHSGKYVIYAAFTPDSRRIVMADANGLVLVWDLAGASPPPPKTRLVFNKEGNRYARVEDGQVTVHEAQNDNVVCRVRVKEPPIDLALDRNGTHLLAITQPMPGNPAAAQLWDVAEGRETSKSFALDSATWGVVLSDDGKRLATRSGTNAEIWDVSAGQHLFTLPHAGLVKGIAFSTNGQRIVTISGKLDPNEKFEWDINQWDKQDRILGTNLTIWNGVTGLALHTLPHESIIKSAEFSPDGTRLVSCMADGDILARAALLWDVVTGERVGVPMPHDDGVTRAAFSPDGKKVATAGEDSKACIWNAETGEPLHRLEHASDVSDVCFSPDGRWLATVAQGAQLARVWDMETGEALTPPLRHPRPFRYLQFVDAGRALYTRRSSGEGMLWRLEKDRHSIAELSRLAHVLSGQRDYSGGILRMQPESFEEAWTELKGHSPELQISQEQIVAWHQREAEGCEGEQNQAGADFHRQQIERLRKGQQ